MPTGKWSCESLETGIMEAAKRCGLHIQPSQLEQVGMAWWGFQWPTTGILIKKFNINYRSPARKAK